MVIHVFGEYLDFHPHLYALAPNGLFVERGFSDVMPVRRDVFPFWPNAWYARRRRWLFIPPDHTQKINSIGLTDLGLPVSLTSIPWQGQKLAHPRKFLS